MESSLLIGQFGRSEGKIVTNEKPLKGPMLGDVVDIGETCRNSEFSSLGSSTSQGTD